MEPDKGEISERPAPGYMVLVATLLLGAFLGGSFTYMMNRSGFEPGGVSHLRPLGGMSVEMQTHLIHSKSDVANATSKLLAEAKESNVAGQLSRRL